MTRLPSLEELRAEARARVGPYVCWICELERCPPKLNRFGAVVGLKDHCDGCHATYIEMYQAEYYEVSRKISRHLKAAARSTERALATLSRARVPPLPLSSHTAPRKGRGLSEVHR